VGAEIGRRVADLLEGRRWTQGQLAQRARLSQPSVSDLVRGRTEDPSLSTILAIAAAFGVPPSALLDDLTLPAIAETGSPWTPEQFARLQKLAERAPQILAALEELAQPSGGSRSRRKRARSA
jgi:transcriptional regulator with XRE-family HTH domain